MSFEPDDQYDSPVGWRGFVVIVLIFFMFVFTFCIIVNNTKSPDNLPALSRITEKEDIRAFLKRYPKKYLVWVWDQPSEKLSSNQWIWKIEDSPEPLYLIVCFSEKDKVIDAFVISHLPE